MAIELIELIKFIGLMVDLKMDFVKVGEDKLHYSGPIVQKTLSFVQI
jgi:hypothetical protein